MEKEVKGRVLIVGDLFPVPSNFDKFSDGNTDYLFGDKILALFASADFRVCNLEGALTNRPGKCEKTGPIIYAPTSVLKGIKELGIDCCTLANNHITDAGPVGVLDTIQSLNDMGITHLGAGENEDSITHHRFIEIDKLRICIYNVAETMYNAPSKDLPGVFLYDEFLVCKELAFLREQCDYLIVIYHGGTEKYRYPSPQIQKRFHRMVDSGANVVLSQHTHCIGSEEYWNGAYLLYGQGNFLFRSFNNEFTDSGLIIELQLGADGFSVVKHIVNAIDDTVRYDEIQDFTSFNKRSSCVSDQDFLIEQFGNYCLNELPIYLRAYKGTFYGKKIISKFFPKLYRTIYMKRYNRNQLLFTLHSLRSEQNREVAIRGLEEYLKVF